jgi:hypothetical protein
MNKNKVNLEQYISNFNLKWNKIPEKWEEGAFNGNGRIGVMVWKDYSNGLRFDIGSVDLYDERQRIPVGKFIMNFKGDIKTFNMTQHLYTSQITGTIETSEGVINFSCYSDVNYDKVNITAQTIGNESVTFKHIPIPAANPNYLRTQLEKEMTSNKHYINDFTHPKIYPLLNKVDIVKDLLPEKLFNKKGVKIRDVTFLNKKGYFLLWKEKQHLNTSTLTWSMFKYNTETKSKQLDTELNSIIKYQEKNQSDIIKEHKKIWSEYFKGSFISIPDKQIESNYWIEIYKIRAATRKGEYPIDLLGPWFRSTPWPRIWCNLNVQITYPITYQSDKKNIAATLFDCMDKNTKHFINAIPEKFRYDSASVGRGWSPEDGTFFWGEYGNFLWMLFNYKEFLDFYPDEKREQEKFYPLLKRGLNFIIHNLVKDEQGIYHFPPDFSPEYKLKDSDNRKFIDVNYNIAYTLWGLNNAILLAQKYKDIDALEKYSEIKKHLVSFQLDEYGYMVAKDIPMDISHRHFSHLAAFYPTELLDIDTKSGYKLAEKSLKRWLNCPEYTGGPSGYTFTAASAMYSRLYKPEKALEYLNIYLNTRCTANTFYLESGPCLETPLHSGSATLEMLMQSNKENEARVFLGIPKQWDKAYFESLPVKGGHKISALLENGHIVGINLVAGSNKDLTVVYPEKLAKELTISTSIAQNELNYSTKTFNGLIFLTIFLKKDEMLIIGKKLNLKNISNLVSPEKTFHYGIN